jgi:hypothetical protein
MNKYKFLWILVLIMVVSVTLSLRLSHLTGQMDINLDEVEQYLRTANIVSVIPDENLGRTVPWRIDLDDGKTKRKGFFKHIDRCRPDLLPDCYKYELAAYELSKLLDLKVVPPTVFREVEGISGSLQMMVEGCQNFSAIQRKNLKLPDPDKFKKTMLDIVVFENLTYCVCNDKDILVHMDNGHVCRVDFSEAFVPVHELLPGCKIKQCSDGLAHNLKKLNEDQISAVLTPYLNEQEIEAVVIRKNLIIKELEN